MCLASPHMGVPRAGPRFLHPKRSSLGRRRSWLVVVFYPRRKGSNEPWLVETREFEVEATTQQRPPGQSQQTNRTTGSNCDSLPRQSRHMGGRRRTNKEGTNDMDKSEVPSSKTCQKRDVERARFQQKEAWDLYMVQDCSNRLSDCQHRRTNSANNAF